MKKIITFGASNSKQSINKNLAHYAAKSITDTTYELIDLNDFEMPIYSIDRETEQGVPQLAYDFKAKIKNADGIIISFAEHNGAYTAAYKNIYDWVSRIEKNVWNNKPMLLMATSPGARGGASVLNIASTNYKYANSNSISTFSLPSFNANFSIEKGIKNEELLQEFKIQLNQFKAAL